ncbi:MAG: HAD-superfamily hydrolase, subfamily IA, variant 1, partial [uncultured Nocardioidaceae bacterium]
VRLGRDAHPVARRRLPGGGAGPGAGRRRRPPRGPPRPAGRAPGGLGQIDRPPHQCHDRRRVRPRRPAARRVAADGVPRLLGAAQPHRPRRPGALRPAPRRRRARRRAVEHHLAPRLARGVLRPRRRPRPHRRRRLHQRGALDEAGTGGVPRRGSRGGGRRPAEVRLRGRPALRRRLGCGAGRHADHPRAALRHPRRAARPQRRGAGCGGAPAVGGLRRRHCLAL